MATFAISKRAVAEDRRDGSNNQTSSFLKRGQGKGLPTSIPQSSSSKNAEAENLARFSPWLRYTIEMKNSYEKAENFYQDKLLSNVFFAWKGYYESCRLEQIKIVKRMNALAVSYYRRHLLRFVWRRWKLYRKLLKARALTVSGEFSRIGARKRAWKAWRLVLEQNRRIQLLQLHNVIIPNGKKCILRFYYKRWLQYRDMQVLERDVQARCDLTWHKVQGWMSNKNV